MKQRDMFNAILDFGMRKGTLTFDEINEALPGEFFSLDELEDFMDLLDKKGVKVVDYKGRVN